MTRLMQPNTFVQEDAMQTQVHTHARAPARPENIEREAHRVHLGDVELSPNARFTLGQAVKEIAAQMEISAAILLRCMQGEVWWHPAHDSLLFVVETENAEAVMYVEIPADHWRFREINQTPQ